MGRVTDPTDRVLLPASAGDCAHRMIVEIVETVRYCKTVEAVGLSVTETMEILCIETLRS